jgi:DNA phosphorothioation-dependent restriction protein DptG
MKVNGKTFAGIGLGVLAGYFIFKNNNKKLLFMGGTGLAGGILANLLLNRKDTNTVTITYENFVDDSKKDDFDEFEGDGFDRFKNEVSVEHIPTMKPISTPSSTKEMFDIDLGFTR